MAKIMNIQLKGIKTFEGMEGRGFNATLYLNNKKAAFVRDSGDGGEMYITWLDNDLRPKAEKIISEYYKKYPAALFHDTQGYKSISFVEELLELKDIEKYYKICNKGGYMVVVKIIYNSRMADIMDYNFHKQDLYTCYREWNKKTEAEMKKKYDPVEYRVFKSLDDFNIQ